MSISLSANTQVILLLTAPLMAGHPDESADPLSPSEYRRLSRVLSQMGMQPANLLNAGADELSTELNNVADGDRFKRLLDRRFQLTRAVERWESLAIWVVSQADDQYPQRITERLKDLAPAVIYGCGEAALLNNGGLAVVGSREVDTSLIEYTEGIGRLAALAKRTIVSGAARGIDQAAMRGALAAGGKSVAVLADSLERSTLNRENRNLLIEGNLVFVSPYDPAAGFNIGHAMQRNKVIYSLADAALVVNSDYEKGGTWAGAVEQLEKLRLVSVYVRADGTASDGLDGLRRKGAIPWPNPSDPEALRDLLDQSTDTRKGSYAEQLSLL